MTKYLLQEENAQALNDNKILSAIESILFFSGEAVELDKIKEALELESSLFDKILDKLKLKYSKEDSGLQLLFIEDSIQLVTKKENYSYIQKALDLEKKKNLSKAGAEVLAILAYKAPLTRLEIEQIRGVNSSGSLQRLIDQGLVEACGKKDVIGKPNLYKTTEQFLKLAGIQSLDELPSFDYFNESLKIEDSDE